MTQELRHSIRSLRRAPGFTIAAVVTLAIGLGSSAAIFALVNGVLLRPLPYGHPDRLVGAWHDLPAVGMTHQQQTVSTYFAYQRLAHSLEAIGAYREGEANIVETGRAAEPARVATASISATLLPVLEAGPLIGRAFTDADDRSGAPPVALIDERLWRSRFRGDPAVVGRTLDVNGITREIVGVMPARFEFPTAATRLWIPIQLDPLDPPAIGFQLGSVARLRRGVSVRDAERDLAAVLPRAAEMFPKFVPGISTKEIMAQTRPEPRLVPLRDDITSGIAGTLWMIAAATALLLLVACANVVNLTLVRANAQQHEMAVREALGAGRGRGVLRCFFESLVVAGVAAAVGLAAAAAALRAFVSARPADIPRLSDVGIDAPTIVFALTLTVFVAAACSLLPALRVGRGRVALREGGRSRTAGRVQQRVRGVLVAAQVALAFVALAGSGLLLRTHARLDAVQPGFDAEHVSTFWISLPPARHPKDADVAAFFSRLADRVAALPGVQAVGLTSRLPLETHGLAPNPLYPEGDASYDTKLPPLQLFTAINGDYFRAMGIPVLAGRTFDRLERQRGDEAVVSLSTARFFWKDPTGVAAIGKRFRPVPTEGWITVIGVVADVHDTTLAAAQSPVVYLPDIAATMALVVRTTDERVPMATAVQQAVREFDAAVPTFDARPMSGVLRAATARLAFVITIVGGAAAVTLLLAAVGLYGVLAYVVALRKRELSIRIALGAPPRAVAAAMARYGISLTGAGIVFGLALFAVAARVLRASLFEVAPSDPVTLGGSTVMLFVIAVLASWLPARRAARVDPAAALRAES